MALTGCKVLLCLPEWDSKHTYDAAYVKQWIQEAGGEVVGPEGNGLPTHVLCDVVTEMEQAKAKYQSYLLCNKNSGNKAGRDVAWCSLVWLFGCLEGGEVLPVGGSALYGPLMNTKAREKARLESIGNWDGGDGVEMRICVTGFEKRKRRFVHTIVESMGGVFSKELHLSGAKKANVLVALHGENDGSDKANAARKHGIPVVNIQWLLDCLGSWEFLSPKDEKYRKDVEFCIVFKEKEMETVEDDVAVPDSQTSLHDHDLVVCIDDVEQKQHEYMDKEEEDAKEKNGDATDVEEIDEDESQSRTPSHMSLDKEVIGNIIADDDEKEEEINLPSCVDQSPGKGTPREGARAENGGITADDGGVGTLHTAAVVDEADEARIEDEKKSCHPTLPINLEPVSQDLDSSSISNGEENMSIKEDAVEAETCDHQSARQEKRVERDDKRENEEEKTACVNGQQPLAGIESKSHELPAATKTIQRIGKAKPQNKRKNKAESKKEAKEKDGGIRVAEDAQNETSPTKKKQPVVTKHRAKKAKVEEVKDESAHANREKKNFHITLSGMHSDEQASLVKTLKSLRLPFTIGTHSFKPHFTHIIAPCLKRNQKCLSGLASGAWMLDPSYVRDSGIAGSLVANEEPYELQQGDGNLGIEERVAGYWRQKRNSTGCRAFEGLTFCLAHITSHDMPSREDVRSIIQAGGGTLVPMPSKPTTSTTPPLDLIVTSSSSHLPSIRSKFPNLGQESKPEGSRSHSRAAGRKGTRKKQQDTQLHRPLVVTSSFIIAWLTSPSSPELLEESVLIPESAPESILQSFFKG